MKVKADIIKVTPELASEWLQDRWPEQRTVKKPRVARLLQDMNAGQFRIAPDAVLRVKGKLANGQHRLEALVQYGKPLTMLVMESNDEELYKVIDAGMKRTVGDGLTGIPHNQRLNSIAGWVKAYDNNVVQRGAGSAAQMLKKQSGTGHDRVFVYQTQSEMIDYCLANQDALIAAVSFVEPLYSKVRILSLSIGGAIHVIGSRRHREQTEDFLHKVYIEGGPNAAGDLKNRLTTNHMSNAKIPKGYIFGLCMKSLRSFIQGTRLGTLKLSKDEAFPTL